MGSCPLGENFNKTFTGHECGEAMQAVSWSATEKSLIAQMLYFLPLTKIQQYCLLLIMHKQWMKLSFMDHQIFRLVKRQATHIHETGKHYIVTALITNPFFSSFE